uniref:Uncharacterized protein n=1 Tax=viral metagenome TaxID=1070528 RepID=A0A6C0AY27_9ZZZZ
MPKNTCMYCNKTYSRVSYYKRHVLLCEMVHSSKFERNMNIEENNTLYSYNDLVNVVQELKYEFVKMQEEFKKLKKENVILKSKQIDKPHIEINETIVTPELWLLNNKDPVNINEWINNMNITFQDLQHLDDYIVYNSLYKILEHVKIPIYIINNNYYSYNTSCWDKIDEETINSYYQKIIAIIWNIFLEWQNENLNKIKINDDYQTIYHKRLQNICNKNQKMKYISLIKDEIIEKIKI